jgi:4-oxalocrotonate tautomerase
MGLAGFNLQPEGNACPKFIFMSPGRSVEQKRKVARQTTDILVENFNVAPEVVVVQFMESPRDSKAPGGILFSEIPPPTPKPDS